MIFLAHFSSNLVLLFRTLAGQQSDSLLILYDDVYFSSIFLSI